MSIQMSVTVTEITRGITFTARMYRFNERNVLDGFMEGVSVYGMGMRSRIIITFCVAVKW